MRPCGGWMRSVVGLTISNQPSYHVAGVWPVIWMEPKLTCVTVSMRCPVTVNVPVVTFGSDAGTIEITGQTPRSEEHTSELQSQSNLVCRLLLEKKKKKK